MAQQHAFAQPRPAALVFELADHLEQFVRVVVDPARAPNAFGLRFLSSARRDWRPGSSRGVWALGVAGSEGSTLVGIYADGHSHGWNRAALNGSVLSPFHPFSHPLRFRPNRRARDVSKDTYNESF